MRSVRSIVVVLLQLLVCPAAISFCSPINNSWAGPRRSASRQQKESDVRGSLATDARGLLLHHSLSSSTSVTLNALPWTTALATLTVPSTTFSYTPDSPPQALVL
ncbi:unnamed protein product [Sphagnum troendelagicum]|uniref:Secreted protein n=1 Tax=Sphagnum troendelagicum TaxID=128251 RepID=A0ABP0TFT4_9BRYO